MAKKREWPEDPTSSLWANTRTKAAFTNNRAMNELEALISLAPGQKRSGGVGSKESYWDDLMNNKGDWWNPNWEKKLDGTFNNLKGPDYKHKKDNDKALTVGYVNCSKIMTELSSM